MTDGVTLKVAAGVCVRPPANVRKRTNHFLLRKKYDFIVITSVLYPQISCFNPPELHKKEQKPFQIRGNHAFGRSNPAPRGCRLLPAMPNEVFELISCEFQRFSHYGI